MKRTLLITLLIATMLSVQAQKVWTLDQCIDYALEHNLDIRKSQLAQQQAEYQYKASKSAWLPTLNANAGEYFGFGQSPIDIRIVLMATALLIVCGVLAGFFPARNAVKIKPIEAMNYR